MDLTKYGVHVELTADRPCYRLTNLEKLPGNINARRHNIFVRAWNADGTRDRDPTLRIFVESIAGKQHIKLDKGDGVIEFGHGDVPMWMEDTYTISLTNDLGTRSDKVSGLHIRHFDEEPGNAKGHFSFLAEFRYTEGTTPPPPINDTKERLFQEFRDWFLSGQELVGELEKLL